MKTIIDFSASFPSAASVKAAGHSGIISYISPPRESWMKAKPLNKNVVKEYQDAGLDIAVVWQYAKGTPETSDVMRGARGGELDAKSADLHLKSIGLDGWPVFFAVDFDANTNQFNNTIRPYLDAAAKVLGRNRVGVYGSSELVHWAGPETKSIAEVAPGRFLGWITQSWRSRNPDDSPRGRDYAVLFQGIHNVSGPDGVQIDVNEVFHDYFGQHPPKQPGAVKPVRQEANPKNIHPTIKPNPAHRGDPHFLPDVLRAFGVPVKTLPGWDKWGMGDFNKIWGVGVHHTGANNTSAEYIARNAGLGGGLSSQLQQSRTAPYAMTLCGVGIAWHMGKGSYPGLPTNNANPLLIGIEPQSDGVSPWPAEMLDIYYRTVAAILWYLGLPASRCISHWEYSLVAQGKWDPGAGNGVSGAVMDMDHFRSRVQFYIDNPPFLKGTSIMALDLNKRYKSRAPEGYFEGKPYEGYIEDFWLNADAHAWVARVNTERIMQQQKAQHEERKEIDLLLAQSISDLATAIREQ